MNLKQTTLGNLLGLRMWLALLLVVAFIPAMSSLAQDDDAQRELEGARQRIHEMLRQAEEFEGAGRKEAAEKMRQNAHEIANRIEQHLAQQRRGQGEHEQAAEHLHKILEGLEHGMVALREINRQQELQALERIAKGVRRRLEGLRVQPNRERQREHRGEGNEREMAMHQLEILRMAMPALREGERRDAADLLERAIHVRELALEGVRNEKAQKARQSAPNQAQLSEILGLASRLWDEFGHEEKAHVVGELAEQMGARIRRERERENDEHAQREQDRPRREARERRQERDGHEARERREDSERHEARERRESRDHRDAREGRDRPERLQAAMERIEQLEAQIKRLSAAMERLQGQLHSRDGDKGRDRDRDRDRR